MTKATIRVGADGSPGSRRALEWALREADVRNCGVELVTVYQTNPGRDGATCRAAAEAALRATMNDIVAGRVEVPTISWQIIEGDPADVLVRESAFSQLLVLGSHGTAGLIHSAMGSVADACARLAECPVVIVPPPPQESSFVGTLLPAVDQETVADEPIPEFVAGQTR